MRKVRITGLPKAQDGAAAKFKRDNLSDADIRQVQAELVKAGYNIGATGSTKNGVDGKWGPKTEKAYQDFIAKQQEAAVVRPEEVFNEEGSVEYNSAPQQVAQAAPVQQVAAPQVVAQPTQTAESFSDGYVDQEPLRNRYAEIMQGLESQNKQLDAEKLRVSKVRGNVIPTAKKIADSDNFSQDPEWWKTKEGQDYRAFLNAKSPQELEAARKNLSSRVKNLLPNDGKYTVSKWDKATNAWNPQNKPSRELYCTPYGCFAYQEAGASDVPIVQGNMGFQSMVGTGALPFEKVTNPQAGDMGLLIGYSPKDYSNPSLGYTDRAHHTVIYNNTDASGVVNAYNADDGVRLDYELGKFPLQPNNPQSGSKKFEYYRYVGQTKKMQQAIDKSKQELADIENKINASANQPVEYMAGRDMTSVRGSAPELQLDQNLASRQYGGSSMSYLPKAAMGGSPYNQTAPNYMKDDMGEKHMKIRKFLESVPRDEANIEAERGETVVIPNEGGLPAHYKIGGQRHHSGGTPLNVPQDSFIYSDTRGMKIKDPELLKEFGMPEKKGGYTPAEIAKRYDINKYREILQDSTEDDLAKDTAEKMIKNFNLKLGKLALLQEGMKGFPTGIPLVALPYMEANSIEPEDVLPGLEEPAENPEMEMEDQEATEMMDENPEMERYGGTPSKGNLNLLSRLRKVRVNVPTDPNNGLYIMEPGGAAPPSTQNQTPIKKKAKIPEDAVIIKRGDYKTEEEYKTARDKVFKEAKDKNKVYVDAGDGTFKRVQSKAFQYPDYKGQDLDKAFKGNKERANKYQYIEDQINGNPQLKQKLYDETVKMLEETKKKNPKSLKTRGVDIDKMIAELTPDKVAENFLQMQKRNIALGTQMGEDKVKGSSNAPTAGGISNKELTEASATAGIPMPDAFGAALQQASYVAFDNLAERNEAPGFTPGQFGAADEKTGKKPTISPVDAIYTNTTSGQITGIAGEDGIEEVDPEMEDVTETPTPTEEDPYKSKDPRFGYYTQDDANLALATKNLFGVKKRMPWMGSVNLQQPDLTYHDPTGAQQRSLGAYNSAVRAAGAFGTGQGTARLSDFMAKAMENSAMIEAQTQQADVAVTNQFKAQKADTWNKGMFANADLATALYDKTMVGDQAYQNSKNMALGQVVAMRNNRLTNAVNTYNINTMNPNFQVDPTAGGKVDFYQGSKMEPGSSPTFSDTYASLRRDRNLSTVSNEDLVDIAKQQMGMGTGTGTRNKKGEVDANKSYMDMYNSIYPGQVGPPQQGS
jgi:hypothetical protein